MIKKKKTAHNNKYNYVFKIDRTAATPVGCDWKQQDLEIRSNKTDRDEGWYLERVACFGDGGKQTKAKTTK